MGEPTVFTILPLVALTCSCGLVLPLVALLTNALTLHLLTGYQDPHVICGDLDSIRTEVTEYYQSNKFTEFCKDADQYSTDFIKALKVIESRTEAVIRGFPRSSMSKHNTLDVVVLGGLSGRADQAFSQIHHLFVASKMPCFGEVYLVTTNSIVLLLREGSNTIRTQTGPGALTKNIGIIPVGKPSIISTKGLEWDVETWYTEFGGQISTSNHIKGHVVRVDTTEKVLFTAEWAPREQEEPSSDLVSQGKSQGKMRVQTDGLAYAATMEERDRWVSDRLSP